ncbi:MAG: DUF1156 domain-containing protein, partial [Bacteroidaceae bacterium]|nr:DUF1156 domain-containing protein [Bacteroidaceae bacterium]
MQKIIETAIPLSDINHNTIIERTAAPAHPANLHLWWGRSPMYSTQFALQAALVDASEDQEELRRRCERIQNGSFSEAANKPVLFDPFAGFGGIPLAAQQLGISSVAMDLNPVAVMLCKAATEIPAAFANKPPVNQYSLFNQYTGAV